MGAEKCWFGLSLCATPHFICEGLGGSRVGFISLVSYSSRSSIRQPSTRDNACRLIPAALLISLVRCSYCWIIRNVTPDFFASSFCEYPADFRNVCSCVGGLFLRIQNKFLQMLSATLIQTVLPSFQATWHNSVVSTISHSQQMLSFSQAAPRFITGVDNRIFRCTISSVSQCNIVYSSDERFRIFR